MRVLVIHGPNLNLLGEREPEVYGTQTLAQIDEHLRELATSLNCEIRCEQRSGEGEIIDLLHEARTTCGGIILNPGAFAHYSYAIADAIASIDIPVIEVHLSNTAAREPHRRVSVTAASCKGTVGGFGPRSYELALRALAENQGK